LNYNFQFSVKKNYNFIFIEVKKVVIFREDKGTMTKKESKFNTISKYSLNNIKYMMDKWDIYTLILIIKSINITLDQMKCKKKHILI
jgi:hypothetical protein